MPIEDTTRCRCFGSGRCMYGSTATWRGGVGGQSITEDVCDRCWGSGDESNPGPNLRLAMHRAKAEFQRRYKEDAAFRWKQRARAFARRAYNWRENFRNLQKYEVQRLREQVEALQRMVHRREP